MERVPGPATPYEVYCVQCRVTFPVGTRRCLHCGNRIGGRPSAAPAVSARRDPGQTLRDGVADERATQGESSFPFPILTDDDETHEVKRRGVFSSLTTIWILLALGGAIIQTCSR